MDILGHVPNAVEAGFVAWAALRLEIAYRRWKAARAFARRQSATSPPPAVAPTAYIQGAAEPVKCDCCGLAVRTFTLYTDGSVKCDLCKEA